MADYEPFTKTRMKATKGTNWADWNVAEKMTESDLLSRRERWRKMNKRILKGFHSEQPSRLPFEEMFLFGSHPENDTLSISQCPSCGRRYKTQWLHNFHWEANQAGDFVCTCTKTVVIPHKSSSKSDHHRHHHPDPSKAGDGGHHSAHSRQSSRSISPKAHSSGSSSKPSSILSKVDSTKPMKQMKKPTVPKGKEKLNLPPPQAVAPPVPASKPASATKPAQPRASATYTLSIPSDDTGQNESVESLLQPSKSQASSSNYGSKPIQMIATAVQKTTKVAGESHGSELKNSSEPPEKKIKMSCSSHSSGRRQEAQALLQSQAAASAHKHGQAKSHGLISQESGHGQNYQGLAKGLSPQSHKSISDSDRFQHSTTDENLPLEASTSKVSLSSKNTPPSSHSTLQNFKIPLKSKVPTPATSPSPPATTSPSLTVTGIQSSTLLSVPKLKQKLSSSSKSVVEDNICKKASSHPSLASPTPLGIPSSGHAVVPNASHSPVMLASYLGGTGSISDKCLPGVSVEPVKLEVKVESLPSSPPPKKRKKKKSKDEPRKILPLKDRLFDPDVHCGVNNPDTGIPCTRSLTCKTHSVSLRRAVPGRSQNFDQLLIEHKKARDAEKALKVATELPEVPCVSQLTSSILGNSPGNALIQTIKIKSKSPFSVSNSSPLSTCSLTACTNISSISSPSTAGSISGSINTEQSKITLYGHNVETIHGAESSLHLPTVETHSQNKFSASAISSESPVNRVSGHSKLSSGRDLKGLFSVDDYILSNVSKTVIDTKSDIVANPSCSQSFLPEGNTSSLSGSHPPTKTSDYTYKLGEIPMVIQSESYSSLGIPSNTETKSRLGETLSLPTDPQPVEAMDIQDPLSAALEMAAAATPGPIISETSHGYSSRSLGVIPPASIGHSSGLHHSMGLPPAQQHFPSNSATYSSAHGYSSGFTIRHPCRPVTPVYNPTVTQPYSMPVSTFASNFPATATDYQTASFHSAGDYQGSQSVYQGHQSSSYAPTFSAYSTSSQTYQTPQTVRYSAASAYSRTPSYPTTSVYPAAAGYPTASPRVYPPTPVYQTSSLFPMEPPLFSIIDELFVETPPQSSSSTSHTDMAPPSSNMSYQHQPFLANAMAASGSGNPSTMASSMDVNPMGQWKTSSSDSSCTGTTYPPFSGGPGGSVLVTHESDHENAALTTGKVYSQSRKRKKRAGTPDVHNQCENNPGDYLALSGGENIERGFIYIQSVKDPLAGFNNSRMDQLNLFESEDSKEASEKGAYSKTTVVSQLKQYVLSTMIPFEGNRSVDAEYHVNKSRRNTDDVKKKLVSIPYLMVQDSTTRETVVSKLSESKPEVSGSLQSSVQMLASCSEDNGEIGKLIPRKIVETEIPKKHCIENILVDLNEDFNTDIFTGVQRLHMKDIGRLLKFRSSLQKEKKEAHALPRFGGFDLPVRLTKSEQSAARSKTCLDEMESYIDCIPALEVEP